MSEQVMESAVPIVPSVSPLSINILSEALALDDTFIWPPTEDDLPSSDGIHMTGDLEGLYLKDGVYQAIKKDDRGRHISEQLGFALAPRLCEYHRVKLRWETLDGHLILTAEELAEQAQECALQAQQEAEQAVQRADQAQSQAEQDRQRAERLAAQLRALGVDPAARVTRLNSSLVNTIRGREECVLPGLFC
jgi:hypothetical protein